jgi:BMFP domain-containing protein YqiC
MPPKKPAAAVGANVELTPEAQAQAYRLQSEALQRQLAERTDAALSAEKVVEDVKLKMRTMASDASVEEKRQFDITSDMARQYRAMQETLQGRISALEAENKAIRLDLAAALKLIEEAEKNAGLLANKKDEEIAKLKDQMDAMASEFGDMLAETIRKMGDKIELDVDLNSDSSDILQQMEHNDKMKRERETISSH